MHKEHLLRIIREVNLHNLGIEKMSSDLESHLNFLDNSLSNLNRYTYEEKPIMVYFGKNDKKILLHYDTFNKSLSVDDKYIYSLLTKELSIYEDYMFQYIILYWVQKNLNIKVSLISCLMSHMYRIEKVKLNLVND